MESAKLHDRYEELRAFSLSSFKTISQPLGLDLWLKKGFLSWCVEMMSVGRDSQPVRRAPLRPAQNPGMMADMVISLTNILIQRGEN